ncbi:MAG: gamma-butyrobetaine hydroxylase-like domain-containing protein [Pseudomonadota bacterium]
MDVVGADPVGHYAVRIKFSDGHDSGLYTWTLLADLTLAP